MANSDLNLSAQLIAGSLKLMWTYKRTTFVTVWFFATWWLTHQLFGTGLGLAAVIVGVVLAAAYASKVLHKVKGLRAIGALDWNVFAWGKYLAAEKKKVTAIAEKWEKGCRAQGVRWDGQVPKLLNPKFVAFGDVTAKINPGAIFGDLRTVQNKQLELAGILGCYDLVIAETGPAQANIHMYFREPLERVFSPQELPMPDHDNEIAFGIDREGNAASLLMLNTLIIGETGSGKSSAFWAMIADLVRRKIPVELWVCDPKLGQEFGIFGKQLTREGGSLKVARFAKTPEACYKVIAEFEKEMNTRQEDNEENDRRAITVPTEETPLRILVIDEFLSLQKLAKDGAGGPLGRIASQSRSTLMMAVGLAQGAKLNMIGDVRDLFPQAIALKTKNAHVTEAALSVTEAESGAFCSRIPKARPGTGYFLNQAGDIIKFRAPYVTDDQTKVLARSESLPGMITRRGQVADEVAIYRAWAEDGTLLYIGKSNLPQRREGEHIREDIADECRFCGAINCYWWAEHVTRFEVQEPWFANDVLAKRAEERAIKRELPLMNKIHNGDSSLRRSVMAKVHRKAAKAKQPAKESAAAAPAAASAASRTPRQASWWDRLMKSGDVAPKAERRAKEPKPVKARKAPRPAKARKVEQGRLVTVETRNKQVVEPTPVEPTNAELEAAAAKAAKRRPTLGPVAVPPRNASVKKSPAKRPAKKAANRPTPQVVAPPKMVDAGSHGAE